jgi:anti-sigma factor RsiW
MPDDRLAHLDGPDGPHLGDALSALVDGELSPAVEAEARRHLDECADCADELAATQATADLVRGLPAVDRARATAAGSASPSPWPAPPRWSPLWWGWSPT